MTPVFTMGQWHILFVTHCEWTDRFALNGDDMRDAEFIEHFALSCHDGAGDIDTGCDLSGASGCQNSRVERLRTSLIP